MPRLADRLRRNAGALLTDNFFRGASAAGRLLPLSRAHRYDVDLIRDLPYLESGHPEHRLDIYVPKNARRPMPVVLYMHGGGFRILSKDTHWVMGLAFARQGYLVFNISYRLAPEHPFPAALADAAAAYEWVAENAAQFGGDLSRFVIAGESAGANLATALTVSASYQRPEPFARRVWKTGLVPRVAVPACGILQVSDSARFQRRRKLNRFIYDRLHEVELAYLRGLDSASAEEIELANPLLVLEQGRKPDRPLPATFAPVGTADPILDDTRRLKAALDRLGTPCEARYYKGEIHAFHAFVVRQPARDCWKHTFEFLDRHLPGPAK